MWSGIWSVATTRIGFSAWIWCTRHCGLGQEDIVDFKAGKAQLILIDQPNITGASDMKMNGPVSWGKKSFKMFGLTFSSKLYWGSYISPIAKTDSKKTWVLICSMKFLSLGVALYLYKSTIQPCMKYCCNVWADAPSCYLELLDKLQKWICRTVCPSLAASLEPLAHPWNVGSLSLNYKYYFLRCSSELAQLVPLPYSRGKSNRYFDRLHDFSSPFLDVTRMPISTGSFLAQLDSGILCL